MALSLSPSSLSPLGEVERGEVRLEHRRRRPGSILALKHLARRLLELRVEDGTARPPPAHLGEGEGEGGGEGEGDWGG